MKLTIKAIRQFLATPLYLLQMTIALAILLPMQLLGRGLMIGMLGGQRHLYYPVLLGKRFVVGDPSWTPQDYFHLGVAPRTVAEETQLKAYFKELRADRGARTPIPVHINEESWGCLNCGDHGWSVESRDAHKARCEGATANMGGENILKPQLTLGRYDSFHTLRNIAAAQKQLVIIEYTFVGTDYTNDAMPWAVVDDDRIVAGVDRTHDQINQLGGVRGVLLSRKTAETPQLVCTAIIDDVAIAKTLARSVESPTPEPIPEPPFH